MTRMKDGHESLIQKLNTSRDVNFVVAQEVDSKYESAYDGEVLLGEGISVKLMIAFTQHYPLVLPDIFIKDHPSFRAHVGNDGKVCLFDLSAILIRQEMADQLLLDCFDQAVRILQIPIGSKIYNEEICKEFASYWISVMDMKVHSCLNTTNIKHGEFSLVISKGIRIVGNSKNEAECMLSNNFGLPINGETIERTCLVFRIRNGSKLLPLSKKFKWNTIRRYILENVSASTKRRFRQFLDKKVKRYSEYILLIFPTDDGDILFGFRVEFNNSRFCKIELSKSGRIENVYIERIDYSYMTLRGGAMQTLENKRVLLLGCGSIGGYIANNLCQVGLTKIGSSLNRVGKCFLS